MMTDTVMVRQPPPHLRLVVACKRCDSERILAVGDDDYWCRDCGTMHFRGRVLIPLEQISTN